MQCLVVNKQIKKHFCRILNLNTDVFENADIGRCSVPEAPEEESQNLVRSTTQAPKPPPVTLQPPITMTATQKLPVVTPGTPRECAQQINPVVDPYMLTFGNEEGDSYGEITNIAKNHINVRWVQLSESLL